MKPSEYLKGAAVRLAAASAAKSKSSQRLRACAERVEESSGEWATAPELKAVPDPEDRRAAASCDELTTAGGASEGE